MKKNISNTSYQPVSCDLHSQYELAIMHKNKLALTWLTDEQVKTTSNVFAIDVQTKNKAEYLIAESIDKKKLCIRLDHITEMRILS